METRARHDRRPDRALRASPSAAWCAPSSTRAQIHHRSRKSWTGSKNAKWACRWNRSTIPNKVQRAAVVMKEYLAERGRQFATVEPELRQVPPSSLEIVFNVDEGPKVKVGKITFDRQQAFSQRDVIRADEEHSRLSAFRTPSCSRISSPRLTIRPNSKKTRSASATPTNRQGLFHGAGCSTTTVNIVDAGGGTASACR